MDVDKHASLVKEFESLASTTEAKQQIGREVLRQLLLNNPNFMKFFKPLQSMTLAQALTSPYLGQLAIKYVDSILELIRNFNEPQALQTTVARLANVHKNRGITVAHLKSVLPIFTDTLVSSMEIEENKASMQLILSTALPMIGKRL